MRINIVFFGPDVAVHWEPSLTTGKALLAIAWAKTRQVFLSSFHAFCLEERPTAFWGSSWFMDSGSCGTHLVRDLQSCHTDKETHLDSRNSANSRNLKLALGFKQNASHFGLRGEFVLFWSLVAPIVGIKSTHANPYAYPSTLAPISTTTTTDLRNM